MKTSQTGLDLIKRFEQLRLAAYRCPAGVLTIGWGSTMCDGKPVQLGQTCTIGEADRWFRHDVEIAEADVRRAFVVPLNQNQFDALVSLIYNVGYGGKARSGIGVLTNGAPSTLRRKLNAGDYRGAAEQFDKWIQGGGKVLPGLVRRRAAERALFES